MLAGEKNRGPIKHLRLYGERNSGTNLVEQLLLSNFPQLSLLRGFPYEKHAFLNPSYTKDDTVGVVVTRAADTWFKSMFRTQHQCHYWAQHLTFSEFLRHEYWSTFDGWILQRRTRRLGLSKTDEIMLDRHPITGERIENIVELRNLKLQSFLKVGKLFQNWAIIRFEDVVRSQVDIVTQFASQFALQVPDKPITIEKNLSRNPHTRKGGDHAKLPDYQDYNATDVQHVLNHLDQAQEQSLGYNYSDQFNLEPTEIDPLFVPFKNLRA